MEKIERGPERIPIAKLGKRDLSLPSISGGYLFKRDTAPVAQLLSTKFGQTVEIIEPEQPLPAQVDWLRGRLNEAEATLPRRGKPWDVQECSRFWDRDSFRDCIILNEVFKNVDAY